LMDNRRIMLDIFICYNFLDMNTYMISLDTYMIIFFFLLFFYLTADKIR
jgi:hypothetical protein